MVGGLFAEQEPGTVRNSLERSIVFLTPATTETVLLTTPWLSTVWDLAKLYLLSCSATPLSRAVGDGRRPTINRMTEWTSGSTSTSCAPPTATFMHQKFLGEPGASLAIACYVRYRTDKSTAYAYRDRRAFLRCQQVACELRAVLSSPQPQAGPDLPTSRRTT
jgi:hypothetical protein